MSELAPLYYINNTDNIIEVPYTRDRAMSLSPIFYESNRAALLALQKKLHARIAEANTVLETIDEELCEH